MASLPAVLSPLTLPALLGYILTSQPSISATTLVICSSREGFLQKLSHPIAHQNGGVTGNLEQLAIPTLYNLSTARNIRIAFCASVQSLLAYLTAYGRARVSHGNVGGEGEERFVLVNPLSLHAPTSSFSAQGLSRTFAAAVEMALRTGAKLQMVECVDERRDIARDEDGEDVDALMRSEDGDGEDQAEEDPWEQDVAILNVSARRFGSGGSDRAWAGRTIKVKRIASRWFRFQGVDSFHEAEGHGAE